MTAHEVDDNWKLCNLVVAAVEIEGNHSGQNLEQQLFDLLEKFNLLTKVVCIISDNALTKSTIVTVAEVYHYQIL